MLITSTRLYDVTPSAQSAWAAILEMAFRQVGLRVEFIGHAWPSPVSELWARPGLCCAFMCGWPFARALNEGRNFHAVASVVPIWPQYDGLARYRSEFLVRSDVPWKTLEDSFGSCYGWMVQDSQSGWNAPRAVLKDYVRPDRTDLFRESKGPYGNPRGLINALLKREVDLTAIDGWYLDLLRVYEPLALRGLRTLAYTPWTPNPLLVCSPDVDRHVVSALADALTTMHSDPDGAGLLKQAYVEKFVQPDVDAYQMTQHMANQALSAGYADIR